jgi:hypothetical protein
LAKVFSYEYINCCFEKYLKIYGFLMPKILCSVMFKGSNSEQFRQINEMEPHYRAAVVEKKFQQSLCGGMALYMICYYDHYRCGIGITNSKFP